MAGQDRRDILDSVEGQADDVVDAVTAQVVVLILAVDVVVEDVIAPEEKVATTHPPGETKTDPPKPISSDK